MVDYVRYWTDQAETPAKQILGWMGVPEGTYYKWRKRYGQVNEHNGWIPRDHWLEDWERRAIVDYYGEHPLEGYRRLTYMMLDADVVAVSASSVYRVLNGAGLLGRFRGKAVLVALLSLPMVTPVIVTAIALYFSLAAVGLGSTLTGLILAHTILSAPYVLLTVLAQLQTFDANLMRAAASLGASRWQTFVKVIFPAIFPALLTGFALAFARAVGEYGSVIFIAGNLPMETEIASLLAFIRLEEYDYAGASAIALTLLAIAMVLLLASSLLQARASRGAP